MLYLIWLSGILMSLVISVPRGWFTIVMGFASLVLYFVADHRYSKLKERIAELERKSKHGEG